MADQDIQFKVTADVQDAKQGFDEIQQKIDGVKGSASETVPVMGEVSETMKDAGESAGDMGSGVSMLSQILTMGLVAGAVAGSIALIALAKDMLTVDSEVENLTAKLKEHWSETFKVNQEWERFREELSKFSTAELIESLRAIDNQIVSIASRLAGIKLLQITEFFGITDFEEALQMLKTQRDMITNELFGTPETLGWDDVSKDMQKAWKDSFKSSQKEVKDETEAFYRHLMKLEEEYVKWLRDVEKNQRTRMPYATGGKTTITGGRGKSKGGKEEASMTQQFAEDMAFMDGLIISSAGLLRSEFMQAWEDIFGEANSLLEKFIANIVAALADLAAQKMAMGMFGFFASLFTGGAASAVTAIASSSSSGTPIQNNIIIDGRQTAIIYTNGKYNASRLRMD